MTDTKSFPYAVIGATGQQGGAVVEALLAAGEPIRALVRDPDSSRASALASRGVTLVRADQDDPESLVRGLRGVRGLFLMTTYGESSGGTEGEIRRGVAAAEAAARASVPHVVYSSVGGAERHSGVPHFESKRRVEEALSSLLPSSFVRPTFFMENLTRSLQSDDSPEFVLRLPMPADVPLQMVAVADIGKVAAAALRDPALLPTGSIEIAGDVLTLERAAKVLGDGLGKPGRFEALPLSAIAGDPDRTAMFRWFVDTPAYQADIEGTRQLDPDVMDLARWLRSVSR